MVYPPREDMVCYIIDFIEQHQRECVDSSCDVYCSIEPNHWAAGLFNAHYAALLETYYEVKTLEIPPTHEDNADKYWQVDGRYVSERDLLDQMHQQKAPTTRCRIAEDVPHCNLCYDDSIAGDQVLEGKRNRGWAREGRPVRVPGDYPSVLEALDKGFWLTFFDDAGDRGWLRRCRFWPEEAQSALAREFCEDHWWCDVEIAPGLLSWETASTKLHEQGEVIEAIIREERAPQEVRGAVDLVREATLRRQHRGARQDLQDTMVDSPPAAGAVVCRGQWILEAYTRGAFRGLVMSANASVLRQGGAAALFCTVKAFDGPWDFECCDVRSAGGIAVMATMPPVPAILPHPCPKHDLTDLQEGVALESEAELQGLLTRELEATLRQHRNAQAQPPHKDDDPADFKPLGSRKTDRAYQHQEEEEEEEEEDEEESSTSGYRGAWPGCAYRQAPRSAILRFNLSVVGGEDDGFRSRAYSGVQADQRATVALYDSRVEDCYTGVSYLDCAEGGLQRVVLQRNGCALVMAECAGVTIQECSFRAQRLAHLSVLAPPEEVSIWAVDGGPSGWGTLNSYEFGVGSVEDDEVDADGKVRWDETDMGLRQPRLTLQANHADDSCRLWFSAERPATLRGQHSVSADACQCARIVCDVGCLDLYGECLDRSHPARSLDPSRSGDCQLLWLDNDFACVDSTFDPRHRGSLLPMRHLWLATAPLLCCSAALLLCCCKAHACERALSLAFGTCHLAFDA